jgi:hypothetical protein
MAASDNGIHDESGDSESNNSKDAPIARLQLASHEPSCD